MGSMISAGIPLIKALEMASVNPGARGSRATILAIIAHLKTGLTFTDSMRLVQGWMPEFDVALLSVGEKSGRLDSSFRTLSDYYATRAKIIRDTISGLIITVATLHVFLLVFPLGFLTSFVLGIFNNDYAQCVPFLIQKLVVFGVGYGVVLFFIFAGQGQRAEGWRAMVESIVRLVPVLRSAQRYLVLARLSAALEALISAGVSIVEGWQLAAAASGSPGLRRVVAGWRSRIDSGVTPGELVNLSNFFPEMFANLYNTGEQSGQLDDTLTRLQVYYQEEGFRKLRLFTRLMNGTIYGLVALMIAYNVIRFYVGHFNSVLNSI
ncbi:MAG: type II secretion system F family protein [Akkermansiaceae bacterium]|nr:type II secretion system F family protein [Verrucomicrobiales bacterium]